MEAKPVSDTEAQATLTLFTSTIVMGASVAVEELDPSSIIGWIMAITGGAVVGFVMGFILFAVWVAKFAK